jgi:hypothetical protein
MTENNSHHFEKAENNIAEALHQSKEAAKESYQASREVAVTYITLSFDALKLTP